VRKPDQVSKYNNFAMRQVYHAARYFINYPGSKTVLFIFIIYIRDIYTDIYTTITK